MWSTVEMPEVPQNSGPLHVKKQTLEIQPVYDSQEGDLVSILQEALLALGLAWAGAQNLPAPTGDQKPNHPPCGSCYTNYTTLAPKKRVTYIIKLRFYTYVGARP